MPIYAVINETTGIIDNRIVLDDPAQWKVPAGHFIAEETGEPLAIGGTYIDGVYTPPAQPEPPPLTKPSPSSETIVLCDHENRLRSLEGQPPLTLGDFIAKAAGGGISGKPA